MASSRQKVILGLLLFLAGGTLVGWIYERPVVGALIAALLALVWQVRQLLAFDRALRTGNFDKFRYGEGIWQRIFSRFAFERDRANRYRRENTQLLREIHKSTNAMPDGAVVLDRANQIIVCNRAAKNLAGLKRKKDRGQRVDNILRSPDLTMLLRNNDSKQSIDIASPVKDGAWLNCRVVPYGPSEKLLLLRDVTEQMTLNKMRRDFVANASHELRSPLTVIAGYLDALAEAADIPSTWAKPVRQMQEQARRMSLIVSELLELSRLEGAGKAGTDELVDVGGLLAAASHMVQGRGDMPEILVDPQSAARLRGDRGEIESVITNLLSNAVRHTPPEGKVTLTWRATTKGADLVVSDTGEGIAAEHVPRLTERFFRVDKGRARTDGGVGLGLAIVKHVLSRHDAELRVTSTVGAGSEFVCHFPAERLSVEPPIPLARAGSDP
ncbi:phosphate regulon sensor histidine kinase PhoR [Gammaproteobacteria bacterium]|jgi:two-component system phosphate regulon sensor histidine kinase PhoR|nr:phosphate regulon sensor histidine kinase PhoR [Gammaproteobacteria bacterium]